MNITVGNLCDQSGINSVINGFLKLRKQVFIEKMDWELISQDQIKYEQYDMITTTYVIAHEQGEVVGGARLVRTDTPRRCQCPWGFSPKHRRPVAPRLSLGHTFAGAGPLWIA